MDQQEILKQIADDPLNAALWEQYGDINKQKQDWKNSVSAYLASLRLEPSQERFQKYFESLSFYFASVQTLDFSMRVLKLPKQTAVIDLYGIVNMKVKEIEEAVKVLLAKKFTTIFLHFQFVANLTGLGPSTVKKIDKWCQEKDAFAAAVGVSENVQGTFDLKKIDIPQYSDMFEAFREK